MKKIIGYFLAILISQSAGIIGSIFTSKSVSTWYATLQKPVFSPPNWIFGPVWIVLYTLMGVSSYLIWQERSNHKFAKIALIIFGFHLVLNALWSIIFFGFKNPGMAMLEISALLVFIIIIIVLFYKINPRAAYLLIPYLAWVSFASVLNYYLWKLN